MLAAKKGIGFGGWMLCGMLSTAAFAQNTGERAPEPAAVQPAVKESVRTRDIKAISSNGQQPVPFAVIVNKNSGAQVMTDENGAATIQRNMALDTLLFRSVGFMDMVIYPGQPVPSTVRMVEDMVSLEQVEVVSQGIVSAEASALANAVQSITRMPTPVVKLEVPQTAAELLWSTGSVLVQQSQQGGGSPILRGFEANRVLLVVDGVRMNNAIYRSGHLQNAITVDAQILERTDVLLGPNSILFGSDAMGGVIHYHTRNPALGRQGLKTRVSSAFRSPNQSYSLHGDVEWSGSRFASLTSVSFARYGDLRMGAWRAHGDSAWGLDSVYVERTPNGDAIRVNEDPLVQKGSGYDQLDALQKFRLRTQRGFWDMNLQWSTSSDIPRYDVMNDRSNGTLKWAEWNYGPQNRGLAALRYSRDFPRWDIAWTSLVSYQAIQESRIKRRLHAEWRDIQTENVNVWNAYSTLSKRFFNSLQITAGISAGRDDVQSIARSEHIDRDESTGLDTRYPNGGSAMGTLAGFANARWPRNQHVWTGGLRWSRSALHASFVPGISYSLPFEEVATQNSALTGGLSNRWHNRSRVWSTTTSFSTGFRHPNVDDVGKVREKGGYVLVPNDSLRPEYLYSLEQAIHWDFQNRQVLTATLSGFGSRLNDAIVPQNAVLDGASQFFIDGDSAQVQTNVNASYALVGGMRVELHAKLTPTWGFEGAVNWTVGDQFLRNPETGVDERLPMAHIPPVFGRIATDFEGRWWTLEIYSLFSGAKSAAKFGPFATDNLELMLPEGAPRWWTLNAEFSAKLHETVEARVGVRNALDMHYRVFASGISAAGRGLYTSLHAAF